MPDRRAATIQVLNPLARQSRHGNHANVATPDSHPDCRVFPSRSPRYIAGRIIEAKSFDMADAVLRKAIGEQALALLRSYRKRGTVEQIGLGRGVRWKLANALDSS
jgi:hypothetical protein